MTATLVPIKTRSRAPEDPPGLPARRIAAAIVGRALAGHPLDLAGEASSPAFTRLPDRDRALVRQIVATTLRRRGQIDAALKRLIAKPLPKKAADVRPILVTAAAQILFMEVPSHAAVSLAVTLANADRRTLAWAGFVNGVLRSLARQRDAILAGQDAVALNLPAWLRERWTAAYGADRVREIATLLLVEPPLDLSVKSDAAGWAERLGGIVLPTGSVRLLAHGRIEALEGFDEGEWWVQDAAATLPVRLFGDVAGQSVADLCAAPGGKTAQLAAAGARVTAVDVSPERLIRLAENLRRLKLEAEIVAADVLEAAPPPQPFDAVLLDAPCSSTGTLRRHPDIGSTKGPKDVAALAALQQRLLARAVDWVKPGGLLVYATCSLEREEGEAQIARLIASGAPWERVPVTADEIGGLAEAVTAEGDVRTLPCHLAAADPRFAGLDGFFAARLRRRSS
jgi:16S rRNA (cytosine967-C5)-methyltransferase